MSAGPRTQFDLVENFWRELLAVDQRLLERARRGEARRRLRRTLVLAVLAVLALGALAFAASRLFERGEPAPTRPPDPTELAAVPGTVHVLTTTAADPDGGPQWAIRVFFTESQGCMQVGRLVSGKLVALGIGGAFHDDGRYHALAKRVEACGDRRQNAKLPFRFIATSIAAVSGLPAESDCQAFQRDPVACPADTLRTVVYGATVPGTVAVTLDAHGESATHRVTEHELNSFIFVLRGYPPTEGMLRAHYADGLECPLGNPFGPTPVHVSRVCFARRAGLPEPR
jgi:hypothetical protein